MLLPQYIMFRAGKGKVVSPTKAITERFMGKSRQKVETYHEEGARGAPVLHQIENRQKSVQPKLRMKVKVTKPKKVRYLTEQIEKSQCELLTIPSYPDEKDSLRLSSVEFEIDNAYELTRTFKKCRKPEDMQLKQRKQSEQIETLPYEMVSVNKIKMRSPKHKSTKAEKNKRQEKDPQQKKILQQKKTRQQVTKRSSKRLKVTSRSPLQQSKTERRSQTPKSATANFEKRQFLSPSIVKHESSYCFERQDSPTHVNAGECETRATLCVPKRKSMLLFDSNGSMWRSKNSELRLLRETVDLLN